MIRCFLHFQDPSEREWLYSRFESSRLRPRPRLAEDKRRRLAEEMLRSQNFDNFLATRCGDTFTYIVGKLDII